MKRILILGLPGSGKTTWAKGLADQTGIPHVEADRFFWTADLREDPSFRHGVETAVREDEWIFEGHFSKVKDLVLPRAQAVLLLDPPFPTILFRFLKRGLREKRGGTLGWLLSHRSSSLRLFREAIQDANSRGVFTFVSHSDRVAEIHRQSANLRKVLGLPDPR